MGNGDGILTAEEYKTAFHEHGVFVGKEPSVIFDRFDRLLFSLLDEDWIKSTLERIDLNGDGGISLEEFVGMNAK